MVIWVSLHCACDDLLPIVPASDSPARNANLNCISAGHVNIVVAHYAYNISHLKMNVSFGCFIALLLCSYYMITRTLHGFSQFVRVNHLAQPETLSQVNVCA